MNQEPVRWMKFLITSVFAITVAAFTCTAGSAYAYTVDATVINRTTGHPVPGLEVNVVNPTAGLAVEQVVTTAEDGTLHVTGLKEQPGVYLLRTVYQGASYVQTVRFHGHDDVRVELDVYDATTDWDGTTVTVPHLLMARRGEQLEISRLHRIANESSPPKTIEGKETRFTIYIPEQKVELVDFTLQSNGVDIPMTPAPTDRPGYFTVNYAIKPGVTDVGVTFTVPYTGGTYEYVERLAHPVAETMVLSADPSMMIESETVTLEPLDESHGFIPFRVGAMAAGAELRLAVSGGESEAPAAPAAGRGSRVVPVPPASNPMGIALLAVILTLLVGLVVMGSGRKVSGASREAALEDQREKLMAQLVRLDDIHETGALADDVYRLKRRELLSALADIYYILKPKSQKAGARRRVSRK